MGTDYNPPYPFRREYSGEYPRSSAVNENHVDP